MAHDHKPAVVFLRMSPQLRQGLRDAADRSGCSLNAFAVQVLATVAGDPAGFRSPVDIDAPVEPHELKRDELGYPLSRRDRAIHAEARSVFIGAMEVEVGVEEMVALVKRHDAEDPGFFVEWDRLRRAERDGLS